MSRSPIAASALLARCLACAVALSACGGGGSSERKTGVIDLSHDGTSGFTYGKAVADQERRYQTFIAGALPSLTAVEVKIRKNEVAAYLPVAVELREVDAGHFPARLLAAGRIPAAAVDTAFAVVSVPLAYRGLVAGEEYAIVLAQPGVSPGGDNAGYEWAIGPAGALHFGKYEDLAWEEEARQGWLRLSVDDGGGSNRPLAGGSMTYALGDLSFDVVYVPRVTFPTGIDDLGVAVEPASPFWSGRTEVPYALWAHTRDWAVSHGYAFANPGQAGSSPPLSGSSPTSMQPVVGVSWADAIVWCNALSEELGLAPVYRRAGAVLRSSTDAGACAESTRLAGASGFRLPLADEWELAARFVVDANQDGDILDANEFYPGSSVSGAGADASRFAVFDAEDTAAVATKVPNALGLHDLSGNVRELVDTATAGEHGVAGGAYYDALSDLGVGRREGITTTGAYGSVGFRLARN